jgi:hypothetical protein
MNIDKARAIAHRWIEHVEAKPLAMALSGLAPKAKTSSGVVRRGIAPCTEATCPVG